MPRVRRHDLRYELFHVMVKAVHKEDIFRTEVDKRHYLKCLSKHREKHNVRILAFCMMDNHAHILLKVDKVEDLSKYLQRVNHGFSINRNAVNKRKGHTFMDRFLSRVILDTRYLGNCIAYIHNNPVKAKIVETAQEYQFSSMENYQKGKGIVDFREANRYFDASFENVATITGEFAYETGNYFNFHKMLSLRYILDKYLRLMFPKVSNISQLKKDELEKYIIGVKAHERISNHELAEALGVSEARIQYILREERKRIETP